jgi:hypothetical protein
MARTCFGGGMALEPGGEHRALQQTGKTAGIMFAIFGKQVGAELVNRNGHDQLGRGQSRIGGSGRLLGHGGRSPSESASAARQVL